MPPLLQRPVVHNIAGTDHGIEPPYRNDVQFVPRCPKRCCLGGNDWQVSLQRYSRHEWVGIWSRIHVEHLCISVTFVH
jgi:hypothetical protein